MSLGSALQIAQNSLLNVSRQTNVVSRNVTNAGNEGYTRRAGVVDSNALGSRVVVMRESGETQLVHAQLKALSQTQGQTIVSQQLEQLNLTLNGIDGSRSPSALLSQLHGSLQSFAANPSNSALADNAIDEARQLVQSLNASASSIMTFRGAMDSQLAQETDRLNGLLDRFHEQNSAIVNGTRGGRDINDALDQRDALLKDISAIIPVNVITRGEGDVVLVTTGGATLFESIPREVTFDAISTYGPGSIGNAVRIDGVPIAAGQGGATTSNGTIAALTQLRDDTSATLETQLDETARSLISAFAETDATGSGQPQLAGLFTWSGGPAVPPDGVHVDGMAYDIRLNAQYDGGQGGSALTLRDGGANGAAYLHNTSGAASFSDHVIRLVQSLDQPTTFDSATKVETNNSILGFATQTIGWLDGARSDAISALESKQALSARLDEKLSNQTGVNIDEEMALLLQLERSYEASARLIGAVDEMFNTLFSAVR
ncbi:MAG: flagellar hook-associated protein FlgK [Pseudomonadota bacterium]